MESKKPIFWHQGLFLQPQHFQLSDLYAGFLQRPLSDLGLPHFWGVGALDLSGAAIGNRSVEIAAARLLFRDGTYVEYPGNALIKLRSFKTDWVEGDKPFTVYLGVKKLSQTEPNVSVVKSYDDLSGVTTRFATTADPEEVRDLYQGGATAMVQTLHYVVKVFWETELARLDDYETIPVAQLTREGDTVKLSGTFIPPCVAASASGVLMNVIKDIRDEIAGRGRQLEEYKSPRETQKVEFDAGHMIYLLALRSLNRSVPLLVHYMETKQVHPWVIYGALRQLVGELSSFSERFNMLGESQGGPAADGGAVPAYAHEDLGACMTAVRNLIAQLLNEITIGPEFLVRLERQDDYYVADLPKNFFAQRNRFYLVMRAESAPEGMLQSFEAQAKLGARDQVPVLISRALPGVELIQMPVVPQGLPRRANSLYFRIEQLSEQWDFVERSGAIALYWGEAPADLRVELVALRR